MFGTWRTGLKGMFSVKILLLSRQHTTRSQTEPNLLMYVWEWDVVKGVAKGKVTVSTLVVVIKGMGRKVKAREALPCPRGSGWVDYRKGQSGPRQSALEGCGGRGGRAVALEQHGKAYWVVLHLRKEERGMCAPLEGHSTWEIGVGSGGWLLCTVTVKI